MTTGSGFSAVLQQRGININTRNFQLGTGVVADHKVRNAEHHIYHHDVFQVWSLL